jgi:hypothetical protein
MEESFKKHLKFVIGNYITTLLPQALTYRVKPTPLNIKSREMPWNHETSLHMHQESYHEQK